MKNMRQVIDAKENYILPSGMAMVDGKLTGLAGCTDFRRCARADNCLRAASKLNYCTSFIGKDGLTCNAHISVRRAA